MMFQALDSAVSGAGVSRFWMDAIADNVANLNTVRPAGEEPFRSRLVVARARLGGDGGIGRGVEVGGVLLDQGEAELVYDPGHPYADENGMVARPVVDLGEQMTDLIAATRTYQANLAVMDRARDTYMAALRIGRR